MITNAQVLVVEEPAINTVTDSEDKFIPDIPVSCEIPEITLCIKPEGLVETVRPAT